MIFNIPGILVCYSFKLKEDQLSYTTRYVQIYSNKTLENKANYDDIARSHNLQEIPRDPWYRGELDVDRFLANVLLTRCRALSDCLVRQLL